MFVSKFVRSSTTFALVALGLAACGEVSTAPDPAFAAREPLMSKGGVGSGRGQPIGTRTFTIWPGAPVLEKFGDHVLTMPPNVVCDPGKSGYGPSHWDEPCPVLQRPITVTATWGKQGDRPVIAFSPDLRFVPSDNEFRWVQLSLRDGQGIDPAQYYTILWYDAEARQWIDESATDPTLKARTSPIGNLVTRRLRHFSDYALWSGFGSYNVTSGMGGEGIGLGLW